MDYCDKFWFNINMRSIFYEPIQRVEVNKKRNMEECVEEECGAWG